MVATFAAGLLAGAAQAAIGGQLGVTKRNEGLAVLAANIAVVVHSGNGLLPTAELVKAPAPLPMVENPVDVLRLVMIQSAANDEMDEAPVAAQPLQTATMSAPVPVPTQVVEEMDELPASIQVAQAIAPIGGDQISQAAKADDSNDPLEPLNRAIFGFNDILQDVLFTPLAEIYLILPEFVRDSVHSALSNLRSPVVLVNDLLQGEGTRALETLERFAINSTVGLGGLIDVADNFGIKGHSEDFGQTLAVWGMPEGFYLVLPILGPSNPRDAIAKLADFYMDPVSQWSENTDHGEVIFTRTISGGVDSFSRVMDDIKKLKETSIDYYAAVRSITRQRREAQIKNGKPSEGAPLPNIQYDFNAELGSAK